ncbi:unnamed protein product [Toxocara canis]|uniref:Zf-C2H2_12 domain-containing protein n=1 Tax=Toxocara canis TaxID=6265 RepID=A0A183V0W0_TOXCA|nr:unnamed protein product [Toxocara canis]
MMEEEIHAVQEEHRFSPPSYSPFEINSVSSFNTSMFNNGGANVIEHDSIKAQSVDGAPKVGDSQNAEILDDQSNDGTTDISAQAQNSENALLKYFRKYNGATGNGNTNEGSTAADTFRSCISGAGMEPNFFSARMVTDETVMSGVFNTGRSRCHNTMFTSINDKGNPFTKFAAPPYSSKLRSWSNQANNNATLRDEQSNPFCAASGNRKANQAGGALKDENKKTASSENPFRKVVPMRHATQSILETSHDRGVARLDGFARYVVEKEKALEAMRRMEERENNSFLTNDTTFIRKRQSLVHREPARLQYRSKRSSLTNPPLQKRRGGKRMNERNCAGQRRLHSVVKCKNDIRLHNEQNAKVTEDSLFMIMDARTIRTCPICGIPVLGVVSHYRKSHGDWNGKERNKYFMRERIRILRCALG